MSERENMVAVRQSFAGDQLRIARELRRMTQAQLARAVVDAGQTKGLTASAVSQFELGDAVPSADTLGVLVAVLEVDPEFLMFGTTDDQAHLPAFFRSLRATPSRDRKRARNLMQLVHRLACVLDGHVGLPTRDVPAIPCDPFASVVQRRAAAEAAAVAVRTEWVVPRGAVADVVGTIEQRGIVCTTLRFRAARVDAFSVNFSDHPIAVLATDKDKWDRSRFDAAHELGHLVMHADAAGVPEAERQANEFAAAFLMPDRDIQHELPSRADWRRLMELKGDWGVSMAALLMRARTLGVMAESAYVGAMKVMSARGWRRHEPVDGASEVPTLLRQAIGRAAAAGLQPEDLRREAAIPRAEFDEVCELITGSG